MWSWEKLLPVGLLLALSVSFRDISQCDIRITDFYFSQPRFRGGKELFEVM